MQLLFTKLKNALPFIIGGIIGIYFITLNVTGIELTHFPGDLGDARFNNYILEHAHQFFMGGVDSYWSASFIYPEANTITYSDNLLGTAPFYSFFRILNFDRETSFQLWFITMYLLNYLFSYLFLNNVSKNKYAAVLGAFIFTFSIAILSQLAHAQTFPRFAIPLTLWMCFLFYKNLKPIFFFLAIFFLVYQFYCGIYLGFMLSIPVFFMLTLMFIYKYKLFFQKIKTLNWNVFILISLAINLVFLALLMTPYLDRANSMNSSTFENISHSIPTLKSFIYSQNDSLLWKFLGETAISYKAFWDHQIFPGGAAVFCFVVFSMLLILKRRAFSATTKIFMLTAIITFLAFLRFDNFSFYEYLFHLPGFSSMRSITRIINIELIFFGFAITYLTKLIFNKYKKLSPLFFIAFMLLITLDNYQKNGAVHRTKKTISQTRINNLIDKVKHLPKGSIISYEPKKVNFYPLQHHIDAMLAVQQLGLKTLNGYTGYYPHGYQDYFKMPNSTSRIKWLNIKEFKGDIIHVIK